MSMIQIFYLYTNTKYHSYRLDITYPSMSGFFSRISIALSKSDVDLLESGTPIATPSTMANTTMPIPMPNNFFLRFTVLEQTSSPTSN